ncbi:MAG TPA: NAD-dependent epimerase/dehydratase family protein [Thermoanaerobaculia bacterium]|nr:NAD-dependent epimerase/dehydratase family protein [Thermoanaerobaculia bacterium]
MYALVTGGSGFLGQALVRELRRREATVVSLSSADADLMNANALDRWSRERFDRIYHLAAWTQAGDFCLRHPGEQWLRNQQINTTVLRFWADSQPQALLVSMGTSCAYEEGSDLREPQYLEGTPIADLYTYAMTKRMLLVGQQSLERQFGLTWLTAVPSTLYGTGYHVGTKQMHFIFDLAWKILAGKHHGTPIVLWGDGEQRRELVYIDDFVDTLLRLETLTKNEVVNIGEGRDHTIREFAELLCEVVGVNPGIIQYDTARYVGARTKQLNVERLTQLVPDRRQTPLADGLRELMAWLEPLFLARAGKAVRP